MKEGREKEGKEKRTATKSTQQQQKKRKRRKTMTSFLFDHLMREKGKMMRREFKKKKRNDKIGRNIDTPIQPQLKTV